MQEKIELRAKLNARLATLDSDYMQAADAALTLHIIASAQYAVANTIFSYIGVGREIRTIALIEHALAAGKQVCAPSIVGGGLMDARFFTATEELSSRYQNLIEPNKDCPVALPAEIDLIIVPCLSCDAAGNRIGYGGGYYDRYLKRVRPDACKIAVCREQMLCDVLPHGENDVQMNFYVTEFGFKSLPCHSACGVS